MRVPATIIDVNVNLERWPFRRTACDELPAPRLDRDLPRAEQQAARPDRLDIGADRCRCIWGADRLTVS